MKLRLTLRAEADLDEIAAYLQARNPRAAQRVEVDLQAAFRLIETYPRTGRMTRPGLRRFTLPRYPYLIFYGVDEEAGAISVFTVSHGARREEKSMVDR